MFFLECRFQETSFSETKSLTLSPLITHPHVPYNSGSRKPASGARTMSLPSKRNLTAPLVLSCWLYRRYVASSSRTAAAAAAADGANGDDNRRRRRASPLIELAAKSTTTTKAAAFLGVLHIAFSVFSTQVLLAKAHPFATTAAAGATLVLLACVCAARALVTRGVARADERRRRDGEDGGGVYVEDAVVGMACRRRGW
jgi:hypothetical protein